MSLTYILVALSAVIVNNALVERLSLNTRICVGENMQKLAQNNNKIHKLFRTIFYVYAHIFLFNCKITKYPVLHE